ncbi:hypothetical protein FACS189479_06860 [Spirochaetia bacterium]|nr:hypothetical protein FACS189479_06860 [Spirochaetia bacterium]
MIDLKGYTGAQLLDKIRELPAAEIGSNAETIEKIMRADGVNESVIVEILPGAREAAARRPHFERINTSKIPPLLWVVKKWIEKGSLNLIFGDSGTGKSFIAIFLAACVSIGVDFFGYKIRRPGAVVYIAGEGVAGLSRRFKAWEEFTKHSLKDAPIYRYTGVANLLEAATELLTALNNFTVDRDPPILAILDTWAAVLGGDDSNPGDSLEGQAALYKIREKYPDLAILIVHHTGNGEKNRARGAYSLTAAMDTVFKVEKDKNDQLVIANTKNKEDVPLSPMAYKIVSVPLYDVEDEDNELVSSACIQQCEYEQTCKEEKQRLGSNQKRLIRLIKEMTGKTSDEIRAESKQRYGMGPGTWRDAFDGLIERGIIEAEGDHFKIIKDV